MIFFNKTEEEPAQTSGKGLDELRGQVKGAALPESVAAIVAKELSRLEKTDPSVAEYSIGLNYIDWLSSLPWTAATEGSAATVITTTAHRKTRAPLRAGRRAWSASAATETPAK